MEFNEFKRRIGLKIKYYRKLRNLTQAVLAELVACDENYISLIENGHKNVSLKMVYKISNALNISASKFFDIEE